MPHNDPYMKIFKSIMESVSYIKKVDSQREMEDAYIDNYVTKQQRLRDKKITELLNTYVSTYQKNVLAICGIKIFCLEVAVLF